MRDNLAGTSVSGPAMANRTAPSDAIVLEAERWRYAAQFAGLSVATLSAVLAVISSLEDQPIKPVDVSALTVASCLLIFGCWFLYRRAAKPPRLVIAQDSFRLETPSRVTTWSYTGVRNISAHGNSIAIVYHPFDLHTASISCIFPQGSGRIVRILQVAIAARNKSTAEFKTIVRRSLDDNSPVKSLFHK